MIKIGIVTVSDRASNREYEDLSGPAIKGVLEEYITSSWELVYKIIPDEQTLIESTLANMIKVEECVLVFTTGGTGPAKRDVTTEATLSICQKILPGFGELMRSESLKSVPTAILSRQTAGILDESLIVNLPGKPASIRQCMEAVFPAIPYCMDLIGGPFLECNSEKIKIFRPTI